MAERDKISARIRALRAKTVAAGCTEEEALSAAALAAKLLRDYNLTLEEAELRETPFARHSERHVDAVGKQLWKVASAIADLVGSTYWTSPAGVHPVQVDFFGFAHEVEISAYLLEICARAMNAASDKLQVGLAILRPTIRDRRIRAYLDGMGDRLAQRIRALKPPPATGTGLVVVRDQLLAEGLAQAGIQIRSSAAPRSRDLDPEYALGRRAADAVALNPGLQTASRPAGRLDQGVSR
ncbi:DUF2786 domain-containing protein [Brevundimonas sp.]|uniref:DUF7168 domain-containing protein n=1 Tax=Brevundimonas sp. TaxID=1871086 RepID=UPI00286CCDD9|nr:DUF2786 domain-containing protein [Brevundimonas sp.]